MAIDVVVVNYHTDDLLRNFVASYEKEKFDGCTLTIVDVEKEPRQAVPNLLWDDYLLYTDNIGYGRGCNLGVLQGPGINEVILLANADTELHDIQQCYAALQTNRDWGLLGPRQVNQGRQIKAGGIFGPPTTPTQRGWDQIDTGQYSDVREDACFVAGSIMLIKRHLWDELFHCPIYREFEPAAKGALLETPHYFEDTWLGYHARAHFYKCVYYGPVQMIHLWHQSSDYGGWADRQMEGSKAMFRRACKAHGIICE